MGDMHRILVADTEGFHWDSLGALEYEHARRRYYDWDCVTGSDAHRCYAVGLVKVPEKTTAHGDGIWPKDMCEAFEWAEKERKAVSLRPVPEKEGGCLWQGGHVLNHQMQFQAREFSDVVDALKMLVLEHQNMDDVRAPVAQHMWDQSAGYYFWIGKSKTGTWSGDAHWYAGERCEPQ